MFDVVDNVAALRGVLPAARSPSPPLPARFVEMRNWPIAAAQRAVKRGTFRIRSPLTTESDSDELHVSELLAAGLAIAQLRGHCLAGIVDHGAHVIFDPALPADDGDLVAIELERRWLEKWIASWTRDGRADELAQLYGREIPTLGIKLLKHNIGEHMLCALDSDGVEFSIPLIPHRIVGVVRAVTNAEGDVLHIDKIKTDARSSSGGRDRT